MRKVILTPGTRNEIDIQVEKIIRGLGHPEPPLDLDAVFKLQQLDPQYYRTSEDGVVRETVSRVKVGAKLFFERPTRIWEAIKTANLKALWIPEQKRILVDDQLHAMKKRWSFAHEIGHSILDWHRDFTFGDDQLTLVEGYHIDLEAEANYAAGRLLFLQDHFHEHVKGVQHTLKSLNKVADDFKNSWTSTLYRTVEVLDVPAFAIIGSHPVRRNSEEKDGAILLPLRLSTFYFRASTKAKLSRLSGRTVSTARAVPWENARLLSWAGVVNDGSSRSNLSHSLTATF